MKRVAYPNDLSKLPKASGIYLAIRDSDGVVLYVGKSTDIHRRWNVRGDRAHQQHKNLRKYRDVSVHYFLQHKWFLHNTEARLIRRYQPVLNSRTEKVKFNFVEVMLNGAMVAITFGVIALGSAKLMGKPAIAPHTTPTQLYFEGY
jgi:excinuclease UvrABC nuclease subunit